LSLSEATDDESADLWPPDTPEISITATAPALCRTRPVTTWKAWNRLGQQWRKHAPTLAAVFVPLSVVGGVVAVVQGRMLTDQGWTVPLGDVAEWVAGLGSVAAFGALYVAISQWRSAQVERRDQEAGQARLMIAELVTDRALYQEWGVTDDLSRAVVRNHSDAPVFNAIVKKEPNPGSHVTAPVLQPGETTSPVAVTGWEQVDTLIITFTDAHRRDWERLGNGQPRRRHTAG
jgi:hypothetical protein